MLRDMILYWLSQFKLNSTFINVITFFATMLNTTSLLQSMDQQVITNFKKLYTKNMFTICYEATEANKDVILRQFWEN